MDPQQRLQSYCRRFRVDEAFGRRLLPLLERAENARPAVRKRILELVEASFEKEARLKEMREDPSTRLDESALRTIARVLHGWSPPGWTGPAPGAPGGPSADPPTLE